MNQDLTNKTDNFDEISTTFRTFLPEQLLNQSLQDCISFNKESDLQIILHWKYWIQGMMTFLISAFGITGNLTAIAVLRQKKFKSPFNQLLSALCAFDTAFILLILPQSMSDIYESGFLLKVTPYSECLVHTFMCASIFMIVACTFERHFAICNPHRYRIHIRSIPRWKHLAMYIGPVIFASMILNIPMFLNLKKTLLNHPKYLLINIYLRAFHPLTTTGILPMLSLCVLNVRICRGILRLHQRRTSRNRSEVNMTYVTITIVVLFFVLNLPRITVGAIEVMNISTIVRCVQNDIYYIPSVRFFKMDVIARFLMVLNSSLNFVVYCGVSKNFQTALIDWIRCSKSGNTSNDVEVQSSSNNVEENYQITMTENPSNRVRRQPEKEEIIIETRE